MGDVQLVAGRYRIEKLLGKGGMGTVYAAVDCANGKRVALKRLAETASAHTLALFKREFQTLHGLHHANIVEVYDFGRDAEGSFYTMELLDGEDLSHSAPLPWREVCSLTREAASILGLLHTRRLLHRDLSPRNLFRQSHGHLKLIDFGALSPFGIPTEVVGTPPFIAPECLLNAERELDQRADLFALGALAYWLLTSVHAFPATTLAELPSVWRRDPAPPSSLAPLVRDGELPPIPSALDELVLSLLRRDPAARPQNVEQLIDRLSSIARLAPLPQDAAVSGYLRSPVFAGRRRERELLGRMLKDAGHGLGRAVLIEAAAGMGRTRLLNELALQGRLEGALTIEAQGADNTRPYAIAAELVLRLLERSPAAASVLTPAQVRSLAELSPELRERLAPQPKAARRAPPAMPEETPELREERRSALTRWFSAQASAQPLLLLIDDLDDVDEESLQWLTALAQTISSQRVLLVATLSAEHDRERSPTVRLLRGMAISLYLQPLAAEDTRQLLASVFGDAPYLQNVAAELQRRSQGNPAYCLELVEYIVEAGVARYVDGMWLLPSFLDEALLPKTRGQAQLARLSQLSAEARALAQVLSIQNEPFSRANCLHCSELAPRATDQALVELTLAGVLSETAACYSFSYPSVREALLDELEAERRTRAHAKLAAFLNDQLVNDALARARAGLHFFQAGDHTRCFAALRELVREVFAGKHSQRAAAVQIAEQALALYSAADVPRSALLHPLALLTAASFYLDRRLARRYGAETLRELERALGFARMQRWQRRLGGKTGLIAGLMVAGFELRREGTSSPEVLRMLLGVALALNAVATPSQDHETIQLCRAALEPFLVFDRENFVGLVPRSAIAVGMIVTERPSEALRALSELAELLQSDKPIKRMPEHLKRDFLGGCLLSNGILECWRQDERALRLTAQMDRCGALHAMSADQLRSAYYAGRGELARAEEYRKRVETHALELGAVWQLVTWEPTTSNIIAHWTRDALRAKRAAEQLDALAREMPPMLFEAKRARAIYLALRGRYQEVVELLEVDEPASLIAWVRSRGVLAHAYNQLGKHAEARAACQAALARLSDADLSFVLMTLHVQIELALADAGLGEPSAADTALAALLARHGATTGPLTTGAIHEARALVALQTADLSAARQHLEGMRACFAPVGVPSLQEAIERLERRIMRADAAHSGSALSSDDAHLVTRVRLLMMQSESGSPQQALSGLKIALEITGADTGFLLLPGNDNAYSLHWLQDEPELELVEWAKGRLQAVENDVTLVSEGAEDQGTKVVGSMHYCVLPLWNVEQPESAALVLGFLSRTPHYPSASVLHEIGRHLNLTASSRG